MIRRIPTLEYNFSLPLYFSSKSNDCGFFKPNDRQLVDYNNHIMLRAIDPGLKGDVEQIELVP